MGYSRLFGVVGADAGHKGINGILRKSPLIANFDPLEATICEHTVDGGPVDLQEVLKLFRGQKVSHIAFYAIVCYIML